MGKIDHDTRHRLLTMRLPALPQILLRLLELCRDEDSGLDDVAALVARDAALSARLLALAGAAGRHGQGAPRNLMQALMQLGLDTVRTALIGDAVRQVFDGLAAGHEPDLGPFWRHALGTAILARRLARAAHYPHTEEAYLAGLLHDVGQLAMLAAFPSEYRRALAEHGDGNWLNRWEEDRFGFTHAEVAAWLAERWQLDGFLADALLYHHEAAAQVAHGHALVRIVWLAHQFEAADATDRPDLLGCGAEALAAACDGVAEEVERAAAQIGLRLGDPDGQARARIDLAEEVRGLALAGALNAVPTRTGSVEPLRGLALAGRTLFGLDDGLYGRVEVGRVRLQSPWPHLARAEELDIPIGPAGGCVGRAAAGGRIEMLRAAEVGAVLPDRQLLRILSGPDEAVPALLVLPLGRAPCPVLVFGAGQDAIAALAARPAALRAYAREAAARLAPAADAGLRDQVRRAVHEANNPLAIVRNYLRLLAEAPHPEAGDLAAIEAEIERVGRILRRLVRPDAEPAAAPPGDLNRAVRELLVFCRDTRFIPDGVRVETDLQPDLPGVLAGRDSIKQILLNLLKNGVEALGRGGRIAVATSGPVPGLAGGAVRLLVSDDGPGLPEAVRAGLFQPVESGKGGDHAGLGLAIVGELVRRLGGEIECRSGVSGTAFHITLPALTEGGGEACEMDLTERAA